MKFLSTDIPPLKRTIISRIAYIYFNEIYSRRKILRVLSPSHARAMDSQDECVESDSGIVSDGTTMYYNLNSICYVNLCTCFFCKLVQRSNFGLLKSANGHILV